MNLDFGILWIEDSYSPEEKDSLTRRVLEAGFLARFTVIPNGEGIEELALKHTRYHIYDIILLDYHLKDANGDDLAPRVRELFPSTTILFYSGSVREQQLRNMIAAKNVEGVFCSERTRFINRTGELIDQTARALDRLSGMRGLAMRVVAECDTIMKDAMVAMCTHDSNCSGMVAELDKEVFAFIEGMREKYQASISTDLEGRFATRAVDSAKIFNHFRRLTKFVASNPHVFALQPERVDQLRELRAGSAQYVQKVLGKRNLLGHGVEEMGEDGWVLQGSGEITVQDFPDIRRSFASHIKAFREMSDLIVGLKES